MKKLKKILTIVTDECVEDVEEVCGTFILHKPTGSTSVHMLNLNFKGHNTVYLPWTGEAVMMEGDE